MLLRLLVSGVLACAVALPLFPLSAAPEQGSDAATLVRRYGAKLRAPFVLSDGKRTVRSNRAALGIRLDTEKMRSGGAIAFTLDRTAAQEALSKLSGRLGEPARDAKPTLVGSRIRIARATPGRALDVEATVARLTDAVEREPRTQRLDVALKTVEPQIVEADLRGITGKLAGFSTRASGDRKRLKNIGLAVGRIDGTLLSPGENFSLNGTVGPRTGDRGFRTAPVFIDAEKVPGIGGGVSQVTGTLFNAAALAGLRIDEVHPHSRPVSYLPVGRDATVAWGSKDLKFTNDTDAPVYIAYTLKGRTLQAVIFGNTREKPRVKLQPAVRRRGPGHIDAKLYRTLDEGGAVRREQLFSHTYRWEPKG